MSTVTDTPLRGRLVVAAPPGLEVELQVRVVRFKRTFCPSCGTRRVLFRLEVAASNAIPSYGAAMCAACAGLGRP